MARYSRYYSRWDWGRTRTKYDRLLGLFGSAVDEIKSAFFNLDEDARDALFSDYGELHGASSERYARSTFHKWKSGETKLSGKTMERLVEIAPPYLRSEQRQQILESILRQNPRRRVSKTVKINVEEPDAGFREANAEIDSIKGESDPLAYLPEGVMRAAEWLYGPDITAARALIASVEARKSQEIASQARKELSLIERVTRSGQAKAATYTIDAPSKKVEIVVYSPSKCFVATACFGPDSLEVDELRRFRDQVLCDTSAGRRLIVCYYNHGEAVADHFIRHPVQRHLARIALMALTRLIHAFRNL